MIWDDDDGGNIFFLTQRKKKKKDKKWKAVRLLNLDMWEKKRDRDVMEFLRENKILKI